MTAFDTTPLTEPIDRAELDAFRLTLPKHMQTTRAAAALGTMTAFVVGGVLLLVWLWTLLDSGVASVAFDEWAMLGLGSILLLGGPIAMLATVSRRWADAGGRRHLKLSRLAAANRLRYAASTNRPQQLHGTVFTAGYNVLVRDLLADDATGFMAGSVISTTGEGKAKQTHVWDFATIPIGRPLPHILLDAKSNNTLVGRSTLPAEFTPDQRLSLEGDFDRYFTLYCPRDYERDALYLFTPDIMARFVDHAAEVDVEIVDDRLYLYARRGLVTTDPEVWSWLGVTLDAVSEKFDQWHRWRDDRLGETKVKRGKVVRPPKGVAREGKRLRTSFPLGWLIVGGFALVTMLVVLVSEIIDGY